MAARIIFMGRPTADPVVSTSQNGVPYISLDLAVSQRGQNGAEEVVYYQCYFNQTFIERINKAKVRKGSCLFIVGVLELHPFIYQQGSRAGQAGINANVRVVDWDYTIANRSENGGKTQNPSAPQNGANTGGGQAYPQGNAGGAQTPGAIGNAQAYSQGNMGGAQTPGAAGNAQAYPQGNAGFQQSSGASGYQASGAPNNGYPQGTQQNTQAPAQTYPNNGSNYPPQTPAGNYQQGAYGGFQNVPQEQLPFSA